MAPWVGGETMTLTTKRHTETAVSRSVYGQALPLVSRDAQPNAHGVAAGSVRSHRTSRILALLRIAANRRIPAVRVTVRYTFPSLRYAVLSAFSTLKKMAIFSCLLATSAYDSYPKCHV